MTREIHPPPRIIVNEIVARALHEDLARGDLTTEACVPPTIPGMARVQARHELVLSGLVVIEEVYRQVDPRVVVKRDRADGDVLEKGEVGATIIGTARSILMGERVALNFAQRMSGTATMAKRFVDALPAGSKTRIVDTRKTTPGMRAFERFAVRCGGAHNHREDLSSAVLIKDNHIAAAGGVEAAITAAKHRAPHTSKIECEVDTFEQMRVALKAGADIIMLDNFDDEMTRAAVKELAGRVTVEASGGITLERVRTLAEAGVDVISVGALTHSAPSVDLGLDWAE